MKIHVWSTRGVVRDISAGRLSEADAFGYLLALSLLFVANGYLGVFVVPPIQWLLLYEFFVTAIITLVGLRACYLTNGGKDGKDFILRFTCISFPIEVKLSLVGWALVVLFYLWPEMLVDSAVFSDPERAWNLITIFWVAAFSGIFYWRVWHHFALLHGAQPTVPADRPASRAGG